VGQHLFIFDLNVELDELQNLSGLCMI